MAPKKSITKDKAEKAPKATKAAKDGDKPKKALGPYMVFCKEMRPKLLEENPGMSFGEVGKACGKAWGVLSDSEKAKYKQ